MPSLGSYVLFFGPLTHMPFEAISQYLRNLRIPFAMNLVCRTVALAVVAACAWTPLLAQGDLVQSGLGEGSVVLDPGIGGARIEIAGQGWIEPEVPGGGLLTRIWQIEGGWLATGTRSVARGTEMILLRGGGDSRGEEVVPPLPREDLLRGGAVPFIVDGEVVGLAWLAGSGSTSLSVRAAIWDGGEWGDTEVVSVPGPGSQVSLSTAVLGDDSWLLVWTAFDGEDDDVVWSRRVNGVWSTPTRVHADNDTPDIVPRIHATGDGALLSWSWMDGSDYRLKLASFRDGRWRVMDYLGGKGSLYPAFYAAGDAIYVLYRNVEPASWHVLELEGSGRILRRAVLPEASRERPVLDAVETPRVRLRWPVRGVVSRGAPNATDAPSGTSAATDRVVEVDWRVEP